MSARDTDRSLRRRRYRRRRIALLTVALVTFVCVIVLIFWGLSVLMDKATGDNPESAPSATTTTTVTTATTTTTRPTVPTLNSSVLDPKLNAKHILVYNVTYETEIYSRDADTVCAPASTTKLLTAAVLLKYADENDTFTVGDELNFLERGSSVAGLEKGQTLTLTQLLDAMLIPSGNDAAYVTAANVGRKIANDTTLDAQSALNVFMQEMNRVAAEIGCKQTYFVNPDGMTAEGHQTTARDMLNIARYANSFKKIRDCVCKPAVFTTISGKDYHWKNTNAMLHNGQYGYTYITGMKTGFTTPAGHCLVAAANRIGEEVIIVLLGADTSDDRYEDVNRLFEAAFMHSEK